MIRLETDQRYYLINLTRDLFNQWCIVCTWGSKFSKIGNQKIISVTDEEAGKILVDKLLKVRFHHGYRIIHHHNKICENPTKKRL